MQGSIPDVDLVNAIGSLISMDLIKVDSSKAVRSVSDSTVMPGWMETTFQFWLDGSTSDSELKDSIQFLVNEGIVPVPDIHIPEKNKTSPSDSNIPKVFQQSISSSQTVKPSEEYISKCRENLVEEPDKRKRITDSGHVIEFDKSKYNIRDGFVLSVFDPNRDNIFDDDVQMEVELQLGDQQPTSITLTQYQATGKNVHFNSEYFYSNSPLTNIPSPIFLTFGADCGELKATYTYMHDGQEWKITAKTILTGEYVDNLKDQKQSKKFLEILTDSVEPGSFYISYKNEGLKASTLELIHGKIMKLGITFILNQVPLPQVSLIAGQGTWMDALGGGAQSYVNGKIHQETMGRAINYFHDKIDEALERPNEIPAFVFSENKREPKMVMLEHRLFDNPDFGIVGARTSIPTYDSPIFYFEQFADSPKDIIYVTIRGVYVAAIVDFDNDSIHNPVDNCPLISNTNQNDFDGDGLGNPCDPDDRDGDGVLDYLDKCLNHWGNDFDGCEDQDGDGIGDPFDNCSNVSNPRQENFDGDSTGDVCDPDIDQDGILNDKDHDDYNADSDGDGVIDSEDNCPGDYNPDQANSWPTGGARDLVGDACEDSDKDGLLDIDDNCPGHDNPDQKDIDGDGFGDVCDEDFDNDGIHASRDPDDNNPDVDSDGIIDGQDNCILQHNPDQIDTDNNGYGDACDAGDNDDIPIAIDNCPNDYNPDQRDTDGDGLGNKCDPDDDNDGTLDHNERMFNGEYICWFYPGPESNFGCPLEAPLNDFDLDTIPNPLDNCPYLFNIQQDDRDNDGIGDGCEDDSDGDGVLDNDDNCASHQNPDQADIDGDGKGDACDFDSDNDEIRDSIDNCPLEPGHPDNYGCPLTAEMDIDFDGIINESDNCPEKSNPSQDDQDHDGWGDVCDNTPDGEKDNDNIPDEQDNCPDKSNVDQKDSDGDGKGDVCDFDRDGDGVLNLIDKCPDEYGTTSGFENRGCPDSDGDNISDKNDECPNKEGPESNNGCPELEHRDSDGDGIPDSQDQCPTKPGPREYDGCPPAQQNDSDGDGIPDNEDNCPFIKNKNQGDGDKDGIGNRCDDDKDGDGISNEEDSCPTRPGPKENGGCP